jgi:hypothetical protein
MLHKKKTKLKDKKWPCIFLQYQKTSPYVELGRIRTLIRKDYQMSRNDIKTLDKALQRSKVGEGSIKDALASTADQSKSGKKKGLWGDNESLSKSSEESKDEPGSAHRDFR